MYDNARHIVLSLSSIFQSCLILCDPIDCSLPGSSAHWIFQARILEWVAISYSRKYSRPRDRICVSCVSCIGGGFFTTGPPGKPTCNTNHNNSGNNKNNNKMSRKGPQAERMRGMQMTPKGACAVDTLSVRTAGFSQFCSVSSFEVTFSRFLLLCS